MQCHMQSVVSLFSLGQATAEWYLLESSGSLSMRKALCNYYIDLMVLLLSDLQKLQRLTTKDVLAASCTANEGFSVNAFDAVASIKPPSQRCWYHCLLCQSLGRNLPGSALKEAHRYGGKM